MQAQIEIHVVEDHPLFRGALVRALDGAPDMRVGVVAGSVEEFAAFRQPAGAVVILVEEVRRAMRRTATGGRYVSPAMAAFLLDPATSTPATAPATLSVRERQVLALLAAGQRDSDIAIRLSISVRTVQSHLDRIRQKTGRRRRPDLTRLAIEKGILHREPRLEAPNASG